MTLLQEVDRKRGHKFYPSNTDGIPAIMETDGIPLAEKIVHLHYFVGGADWFITELDPATGEAFGWAEIVSGGGEWGYVSLPELATLTVGPLVVERDLHWSPKPCGEVARIPQWI